MPTDKKITDNKKISDLTDYKSILPYASELFGVYQPMIGWKSKRIKDHLKPGLIETQNLLLKTFAQSYEGISEVGFGIGDYCSSTMEIHVGKLKSIKPSKNNNSALLRLIISRLPKDKAPEREEWGHYINVDTLEELLKLTAEYYKSSYGQQCVNITPSRMLVAYVEGGGTPSSSFRPTPIKIDPAIKDLETRTRLLVNEESAIAGALLGMIEKKMFDQLENIFYEKPNPNLELDNKKLFDFLNDEDPFLTFDPKKDIKSVCLSPLGIVHLYRQYFFELDTFLGTPTGHVWLSPGSSVELIEVSTRRTLTEKTFETSTELTTKTEKSTTDKDEISEAVKEDNKSDLKLGATVTVNQSWGSGNSTATASLNMDKTQSTARETVHKRMREQTEKLSTEIKQNYKSTFKTITEETNTSSKRYILNNTTPDLINYELRRKMRQVGVQVQDIGSYLCWEAFVDEPGNQLGLANLIHIAKPVDLTEVPDPTLIPYPDDQSMAFTAKVSYNLGETPGRNGPEGFQPLEMRTFGKELPEIPKDFRILPETVTVKQLSGTGKDFDYFEFAWRSKIVGNDITFGVYIDGEYDWDNQIDFNLGVNLKLTATADKRKEIDTANMAKQPATDKANAENMRKTKEGFITAAKERIDLASNINTRKYEDLREEERIIIYRNLMKALMSDTFYNKDFAADTNNYKTLHVLSELINSIFDVDKMLYFVAPEWWKPRKHSHQYLGEQSDQVNFSGNLTSWQDQQNREDNYYITDKSQYAKMGSSLGWLLQLDGDNLRNAFLNAPWVKTVLPIRPGKELEAINWMQQMNIEGTDGLDALYQAPEQELMEIRTALKITSVTIRDAIKYLCAEVALKNQQSLEVGKYPKDEINDDNKVSATPIDKVYEHGFYPLVGGFRAVVSEKFEICDQWIEVLPTDQVVPVEIKYDSKTGRQTS